MPKTKYKTVAFSKATRALIGQANTIVQEYAAQGFDLTLRQLYYQFVSRDWLANTEKNYKRLGDVVSNARLAGEIDWYAIEDRTRHLRREGTWDTPHQIVKACASGYRIDKWLTQDTMPEVWIEKDALVGVIAPVCNELQVPFFSCRGYVSQSEMWGAGQRLLRYKRSGRTPLILHLGDHDPSGIDMTRDITERLGLFAGEVEVDRLALNMDQVEEYGPPPNPAKVTDARYESYRERFGEESWELDALEPHVLQALIREAVLGVRNERRWAEDVGREMVQRQQLERVAQQWDRITATL